MRGTKLGLLLIGMTLFCLYTLQQFSSVPPPVSAGIDLQEALSDDRGEFASVVPGRSFAFPADHGEHPEFKTEWWYFTGNLAESGGKKFGYQLTLFRIGLAKNSSIDNPSAWSTNTLLMGHFAVSDPQDEAFFSFERFARRSLGLAGVKPDAERIWLEDWSVERRPGGWKLQASADEAGKMVNLELTLEDTKPPVLQGEGGYSRKGPQPEHASYYVSQTRLKSLGSLAIGERQYEVEGASWFDHEWSSEAMAEGLAGWDWFSLQLSDDTELMIYLLRYEDGRIEPASSGSFVQASGEKLELQLEELEVEVLDKYRSKRGVEYPSSWRISVPTLELEIEVNPFMADQEMQSGVPYWEGAVGVTGSRGGQTLQGQGFVEMTGYK